MMRSVARAVVLAAAALLTGCAVPAATGTTGTMAAVSPAAAAASPAAKSSKAAGTVSQRNALRSAQSYLEMSGFSKKGLIKQLSSSAGEGFSKADATWAVEHLPGANWNEQAVRSGKSYLDMSGFSRAGLIKQLSSDAGDGYTVAQATYAADKLGL